MASMHTRFVFCPIDISLNLCCASCSKQPKDLAADIVLNLDSLNKFHVANPANWQDRFLPSVDADTDSSSNIWTTS